MVTDSEQKKEFEKALNRANDIINYCYQGVEEKFKIRQFYNNMYHSYDAILKQKKPWQTKFAHPLPFFTTETKASFYREGIFGQNQKGVWQVEQDNDLSYDLALKNSQLLNYQQKRSNFLREFYVGSKSLGKFGDWFLEVYWNHERRQFRQRDNFLLTLDQETQLPKFVSQPGGTAEKVTRNQPDARTLWVNSVWPDPKATKIENARVVCIRREIPYETLLKEQNENGRYINVEDLEGTQPPKISSLYYDVKPHQPYIKDRNSTMRKVHSPIDQENNIVEVVDLIYPATGEVESIGNRKVYMGRTNMYANLGIPIEHIKNFEELEEFWGTSDYEAIANHWRLINQYQCLEADNILAHHRGYHTILRDAGPNVEEQVRNLRPGSTIVVNNQGAINHTRPDIFQPLVLQAKESLINQAQQPMGLNEILSGAQPSSNVRSSSQFNQLAQFGAKLMSQGIANIGEGIKRLGEKWLMLNYEFLDQDQWLPIFGSQSNEGFFVEIADLVPFANVSVELSGDLEALKEQHMQQLMQAINLAGTTGMYDTTGLIEEWFKAQGKINNPERFAIMSPEERIMVLRSQFGLQQPQGGGQEPGLAGATAAPPPNVNQVTSGASNAGVPANIPSV